MPIYIYGYRVQPITCECDVPCLTTQAIESVMHGDPIGLCSVRSDHLPHRVVTGSLAPYWCTANQEDREPGRAERRRSERAQEVQPMREAGVEAER